MPRSGREVNIRVAGCRSRLPQYMYVYAPDCAAVVEAPLLVDASDAALYPFVPPSPRVIVVCAEES